MRVKAISPQAALDYKNKIITAPMLEIEDEILLHVNRMGFLPPMNDPLPFIQTTDGKWWRLPEELSSWVVDFTALALSTENPLPAYLRFGIDPDDGFLWVELA